MREADGGECKRKTEKIESVRGRGERRWRLREGGVSLRANRVAGGDRKYLPEVNTKLRIQTGPTMQWVKNRFQTWESNEDSQSIDQILFFVIICCYI